jgi:hypothetical protein
MAQLESKLKCPLCGSRLTRAHYEQVLQISRVRKEEFSRVQDKLKQQQDRFERDRKRITREAATKSQRQLAKVLVDLKNERTRRDAEKRHHEKALKSAKQQNAIAVESRHRREIGQLGDRLRRSEDRLNHAEERRIRDNNSWKRHVEKLQQQADAKDQAHFGPEGEEELVAVLKRHFPDDDIQRKRRGGDVIHRVIDAGQTSAIIVYECKRTATWQMAYVRQLKSAMESNQTRYGILVTRAFPRKQSGLCQQNGVLIVAPELAHHVAAILRETAVELARARLPKEAVEAKTREVYRYLQSEEFKSALTIIQDRINELRSVLDREKGAHQGWWGVREKHYGTIARQAAGVDARIREIITVAPVRRVATVHRLAR